MSAGQDSVRNDDTGQPPTDTTDTRPNSNSHDNASTVAQTGRDNKQSMASNQSQDDAESQPAKTTSSATPTEQPSKLREVKMRAAEPGSSLLVPLKLNGFKILAVVDSAAQVTVVSQATWKKMRRPQKATETVLLQGAAQDSEMEAQVVKDVCLGIGGHDHRWTVYIAPIHDNMILGLDFLRAVGCTVDLARDSITIRDEEIPAL